LSAQTRFFPGWGLVGQTRGTNGSFWERKFHRGLLAEDKVPLHSGEAGFIELKKGKGLSRTRDHSRLKWDSGQIMTVKTRTSTLADGESGSVKGSQEGEEKGGKQNR